MERSKGDNGVGEKWQSEEERKRKWLGRGETKAQVAGEFLSMEVKRHISRLAKKGRLSVKKRETVRLWDDACKKKRGRNNGSRWGKNARDDGTKSLRGEDFFLMEKLKVAGLIREECTERDEISMKQFMSVSAVCYLCVCGPVYAFVRVWIFYNKNKLKIFISRIRFRLPWTVNNISLSQRRWFSSQDAIILPRTFSH